MLLLPVNAVRTSSYEGMASGSRSISSSGNLMPFVAVDRRLENNDTYSWIRVRIVRLNSSVYVGGTESVNVNCPLALSWIWVS